MSFFFFQPHTVTSRRSRANKICQGAVRVAWALALRAPPPRQPLQLYSAELSLYPSTRNKFEVFKHFRVRCRALADALLGCRALAVATADVNEKSKPILTW